MADQVSDQDLDKWIEKKEEEFWSDPEEVRLFEEWLENLYAKYYGDEDDLEEAGESFTHEPTDANIGELPF